MEVYPILTMLLTPHTIVGVAVATSVPNPYIAVPIAFALHFVGDLVPHWDIFSEIKGEDRKNGWALLGVMLDLGLGIAVGIGFSAYALWGLGDLTLAVSIFLCGIASALPDALTGPAIYVKNPPQISRLMKKFQSGLQWQAPLPWGLLSQVLVVGAALWLISGSIG